jgi:hypothetical protein
MASVRGGGHELSGFLPDYAASVWGADWIEAEGMYSWTSSTAPNVEHVWEYSTSQSIWYPFYGSTTYTRYVGAGDPSFYLRVRFRSAGIVVGASPAKQVYVNICESDVDWCGD